MLVLAEFEFEAGDNAGIIYEALLPNLGKITSAQEQLSNYRGIRLF